MPYCTIQLSIAQHTCSTVEYQWQSWNIGTHSVRELFCSCQCEVWKWLLNERACTKVHYCDVVYLSSIAWAFEKYWFLDSLPYKWSCVRYCATSFPGLFQYRFEGDQRSMFEFMLVVSNLYTSLINRWYANAYKCGFKLWQTRRKWDKICKISDNSVNMGQTK